MGLGDTKLPRETSILDTSPSGSSRSSVMASDENVVRTGFCDS